MHDALRPGSTSFGSLRRPGVPRGWGTTAQPCSKTRTCGGLGSCAARLGADLAVVRVERDSPLRVVSGLSAGQRPVSANSVRQPALRLVSRLLPRRTTPPVRVPHAVRPRQASGLALGLRRGSCDRPSQDLVVFHLEAARRASRHLPQREIISWFFHQFRGQCM